MKIISPGKVLNKDLCKSLQELLELYILGYVCISYKNNEVTCTQRSSIDLCRQVDDVGFCNSLDYQFNANG